jgi:hypothetical protein
LVASAPAPAKQPLPVRHYHFIFQGDGEQKISEVALDPPPAPPCTYNLTQDATASWLSAWREVELPPAGRSRTYEGKSFVFTGNSDFKAEQPACNYAPDTVLRTCSSEPISDGTPVKMTISHPARLKEADEYTVVINAVGGTTDNPADCPGPEWAPILKKKFNLTVPGLPNYQKKEKVASPLPEPIDCLQDNPTPNLQSCTKSIEWHGTVTVARTG